MIFTDEIDAFGGARFDSEGDLCPANFDDLLLTILDGNDNEVNRTMLELVNQLDGFDSRGAIKVNIAKLGGLISECFCR